MNKQKSVIDKEYELFYKFMLKKITDGDQFDFKHFRTVFGVGFTSAIVFLCKIISKLDGALIDDLEIKDVKTDITDKKSIFKLLSISNFIFEISQDILDRENARLDFNNKSTTDFNTLLKNTGLKPSKDN